MAYKLEVCTVDDAAALARNNMSAFWTDPTWILLWDVPLEHIIAACTERMPWNLLRDRDTRRQLKAVDEQGALVGYARWIVPDDRKGSMWLAGRVADVPKEVEQKYVEQSGKAAWNPRDLGGIDGPVVKRIEELTHGKEYMSLDYIAVHPENRRKGVASFLVEGGIAEAEKAGVDIFVMAYKAGLNVYRRLGFTLLDQMIIDDSQWGGQGEYGCYFLEYKVKKNDSA